MAYSPATRKRVKARIAVGGISKSGKTMTSLALMRGIVGPGGRIAALNSEPNNGLPLYAGKFPGERQPSGFDLDELTHFSPDAYIKKIDEAVAARYDGLILDSLSHEWMGSGGILEMVDGAPANDKFFSGWKAATPKHNAFVRALTSAPIHLIATLRQKDDYVIEKDANGRNAPVKVGTELIQRKGVEYEFNLVGTMDLGHTFRVQHSCIPFLPNSTIIEQPDGLGLGSDIANWLNLGDEEWTPPTFRKAFYVNDKEVLSAGIERATYVRVLNLGAALDKALKRGTAKALMVKPSLAEYTEEEALAYVVALEAKLEEVRTAGEEKVA